MNGNHNIPDRGVDFMLPHEKTDGMHWSKPAFVVVKAQDFTRGTLFESPTSDSAYTTS